MTDVQPHHYATSPFGAHDVANRLAAEAAEAERQEQEMKKAQTNAMLRLQRPEVGADAVEAEWMVDEIGPSAVNGLDDERLKARLVELRDARAADAGDADPADAPAFQIGGTIDSLLEYVDGDPAKAADVAAAERDQDRPRKTLLKALDELSVSAQDGLGNSSDAETEHKQGDDGDADPADS